MRALHALAFAWDPPDVGAGEQLSTTRIRQYVRRWINEWDLVRLDPAFWPQTEAVDIASDYREDSALEDGPAEDKRDGTDTLPAGEGGRPPE